MKLSIKAQFYIFIVSLLAILIFLLNLLPMTSSRDAIFEQKKNSLTSQGNTLAQALSGLENPSKKNIEEILKILDITGYSHIIVADDSGTIVYDSSDAEPDGTILEDIRTTVTGKTVFRSSFKNESFVSTYFTPISGEDEISGILMIEDTDTQQAEIILSLQSKVRTTTIVLGIVASVFAIIFSQRLINRIQSLVESMRIVAKGDYSHRLEVSGNDEITELGNEFNALTEKLETTEKQRRRFVSDASHELKTPIASIRLLSDSIVQSPSIDEATVREFVSDIGAEAERLQNTAEDLLSLSRLDDDIRVEPVPVDMKQVIIDAYVFAKPLADENKVKIKCDLTDGCIIMANSDDMIRVVFNLVENAIKYNVPDGKVDVFLTSDEETVTVKVRDTGIGIPEEDRLNVFSRFYRVDKARSREAGGSGLGLSIVHETVQLYGGTITIGENKPQGTVFTLVFPRPSEEETGI